MDLRGEWQTFPEEPNIPGKTQTLPLAIYDHVQANAMTEANELSLIAVGTVLVILLAVGRLARVRY